MDKITAIHSLEALQSNFVPGSKESQAIQQGIEALWLAINAENRAPEKSTSDLACGVCESCIRGEHCEFVCR